MRSPNTLAIIVVDDFHVKVGNSFLGLRLSKGGRNRETTNGTFEGSHPGADVLLWWLDAYGKCTVSSANTI